MFRFPNWRKRERAPYSWIGQGVLYQLLSQAGFQLVDIGARGGPMRQLYPLSPFAYYFACEPDTEEARRLSSLVNESPLWKGLTVFPEAVSTRGGHATLYLCKQPGLSSLLQPDMDVVRRYYDDGRFEICGELSVPTITLDQAAERYGFTDACFIKLDTQGTELDILRSGEKLISEAVLGIYTEVEFQPFYRGQPLFSDIDVYLGNLGFSLFELQRTLIRRATHPKHLYSRRQLVWADALYLRDPSRLVCSNNADSMLLKCSRLLGLALAFEQFDLAFEIISAAMTVPHFRNVWRQEISEEVQDLALARTRVARKMARSRRQRRDSVKFMHTDRGRI